MDSNSSTLYIVLELMECNLERIFASGHVLSTVHMKVLLKQLLLGVQAMHRHGILREGATVQHAVFTPIYSLHALPIYSRLLLTCSANLYGVCREIVV